MAAGAGLARRVWTPPQRLERPKSGRNRQLMVSVNNEL
jgi:hypothetical protein